MSIDKLSTIWPEWRVVSQIGEGSFGKVYKVVRNEHGFTHYAAVKVISIPKNTSEYNALKSDGYDDTSSRSYLESIVTDFVNEIKLMTSMKATANIVSVEDYKVVEKTDTIGWDIFIRMELLTSFIDYALSKRPDEAEVIKVGLDICSALELCAQKNIVHRDIKPENIFVSSFGDFKLGDFGIARELEKSGGSMSMTSVGSNNYIAPEVKLGKKYDAKVDIYSLGIVLYKLLNNNRLPFIDAHSNQITYNERNAAVERRLSGEPLPYLAGVSAGLADVVLRACMFEPAQRYKTATEFKQALETAKYLSQESANYEADNYEADNYDADNYDAGDGHDLTDRLFDYNETVAGRRPPKSMPESTPESTFGNTPESTPPVYNTYDYAPQHVPERPDETTDFSSKGNKMNKDTILIVSIIGICVIVLTVIIVLFLRNGPSDNPAVPAPSPSGAAAPAPEPNPVQAQDPDPTPPPAPPSAPSPVEVQSVIIEHHGSPISDISVMVGEQIILDALILPSEVNASIEWTSSNQDIFVINETQNGRNAVIIGINPGSATLTVNAGNASRICMIYVSDYGMHQRLGDAILTTSDGVVLTITWYTEGRGRSTVFERVPNNPVWMMESRDGDYRQVEPDFSYESDAFSIGFPTTTRRYFLYGDGTGHFSNRDGSSYEYLTWDFYVY